MAVTVRKRKGKYWVYVYHQGKERAKCIGTDRRLAKTVAEQIQAKLVLGEVGLPDCSARRPFSEYFGQWLHTYAEAHCKASTLAGYETAFRLYLQPAFGDRDIGAVGRDDVKRLAYQMLTDGKSRAYVKATLAPLSTMFNHAIEDSHLAGVNPALRILGRNRSEEGERRKKTDFLASEEVAVLLDATREYFPGWYPLLFLLVMTGTRIGEAIALQWGDLDFQGRFAAITRNLVDGKLTSPKNGRGRRVDLSAQLVEVLKGLSIEQKREALRQGSSEPPIWVFTNERGNPIDPDNFRKRVWPRLLAKAGLRRIRIHDVRHTYASLLIGQGESLAYVREQMGHHSIRVTVDTYGHLVPGGNKAAVDRLDALLNRSKPDPRRTSETAVR